MKKQLLILITLCVSAISFSQTFTENFITYQVISSTNNTVRTHDYNQAGGTVVNIPASVTDTATGNTYSVTEIGIDSFFNKQLTSVTIPNSVQFIINFAFGTNQLTTITIPDSVISIGGNAFVNNQLNSITLSNGLTAIGLAAFASNQLTSVTIPDSVNSIAAQAFNNNPLNSVISLATVPPAITSGSGDSFGNRSVIDLTIPAGTSAVYAAGGWTGFNSVTESGGAQVGDTFVENFTTYEITSLSPNEVEIISYDANGGTVVNIPQTVTNSSTSFNVTSIGASAYNGRGLTSVTIPDTVTIINIGAFLQNSLTSITIPDSVTFIGNLSFKSNQITSVVIPSGAIAGFESFKDNALTNVSFEDGITSINPNAFENNQITNITIPSSVTFIGSLAFAGNPLNSITSLATTPPSITTGTNDTFGSIANRGNIDLTVPAGTTGSYVTDSGALWTGFNSVTEASPAVGDTFIVDYITYEVTSIVPDNVRAIDYDIAGGTAVDIPPVVTNNITTYNITAIGSQAFVNKGLTSVAIGNNVADIGFNAFYQNQISNGIVIPNSVTNIGARAFDNNQITDVIIGSGVTNIEFAAFRDNPLSTVISLAVTPPTIITDPSYPGVVDSFSHDRSNINLVLTNTTTDEYVTDSGALWTGFKMVFEATSPTNVEVSNYDSANGVNVVIPSTVTAGSLVFDVVRIDDSAFENIGLTSVTIPDSVTEIGISAFQSNSLTSVIIPDSVTLIGTTAFALNSISNLTIGANVTDIGIGAFVDNDLANVTIPSNVTSIGLLAFGNNPLTDVTSLAITPPTITTGTNDTFAFDRSNIHLHIPSGTLATYVTDPGALWTGFNPVTEDALSIDDFELSNTVKIITSESSLNVVANINMHLNNYEVYALTGAKVATGNTYSISTASWAKGIYILKLDFDRGIVTKKVIIN